jgi:hypothetical protein
VGVFESEKRAAQVMQACLGRIDNGMCGSAFSKWTEGIRSTKEHLRRTQDNQVFMHGQNLIMTRVKARLFFTYLEIFHLRLITGSFVAWLRFLHSTDRISAAGAAVCAAKAAAVAAMAAAAAKSAATAAGGIIIDDELAKMLASLIIKSKKNTLSELTRLHSEKALFKMLCRKVIEQPEMPQAHKEVVLVGGRYKRRRSSMYVQRNGAGSGANAEVEVAQADGGVSLTGSEHFELEARRFILEYFKLTYGNDLHMKQEGGGKKGTVTKKKVDEFLLALLEAEVRELVIFIAC